MSAPLDPERWRRIEPLLDAALDLPPDKRPAFLDQACHDDPELRAEVEALLRADAAAGEFLETPAGELARSLWLGAPLPEHETESVEGQRIGCYRVIRELGRGGMGSVYLAERADGAFEQRVALKLIRRGMDSDEILERFLRERQILARLQHPGIARLLDGGITKNGRPFFAMDIVEGTPITAFCDDRELTIDERLGLFLTVCDAVSYAHRSLVVHRDLKPSNILVAADGRARLLDFGIAKLLREDGDTRAALTRLGGRALTPEYAAPEQVRGDSVTTATDVYALGVVLYELLTGHRPYRFERATPTEIERVVCETLPPPPSTAATRAREIHHSDGTTETITPADLSRARGTEPERLRRHLGGDLDNIVLSALVKEPERRYPSADALGEDLRRHLAGLPVRARRQTAAYRIGKFVGRHRVGVGVAAAFVALLLGFSVVTAVQAGRIEAQAARITQERDKAERVAEFLVDLFRTSDPYDGGGGHMTVREVLDSGAVRIDRELADQPELRAEMMAVMAQAYYGHGLFAESRRLTESSLDIRQRLYGDTHPAVAGSLTALAQALLEQGDYTTADSLYRRSLAARRAHWGADHPQVARTINSLGRSLRLQGRYAEAEPLLREALAIDRKYAGERHADPAQSLRNLAHVLRDRGDYAAAEPLYREALALHRERYGDEHPESANSRITLGAILRAQGRHAEAEPLFREGLSVKQRLLGEDHPDLAMDRAGFAALLHDMGRDSAAEDLYRRALAVQRRALPAQHPQTATTLLGLGRLLLERGHAAGAEPLLREALAIHRERFGETSPRTAAAARALHESLSKLGRHAEAGEHLPRSYTALENQP